MKILIDARQISGQNGGVEQAIQGLAKSFQEAEFSDLEFIWLMFEDEDWLQGYLPSKSSILYISKPKSRRWLIQFFLKSFRKIKILNALLGQLRKFGIFEIKLQSFDKMIDVINPDLIHFTSQFGFKTNYPNIYQPHDLQHKHYPEYFTSENLQIREKIFGEMFNQATKIVVGNYWTLEDFIGKYPNIKEKIYNVPVYSRELPTSASTNIMVNQANPYLYYPAAGWPHKNHLNLFRAFKFLVMEGFKYNLVLTGNLLLDNKFIMNTIAELGLTDRVIIRGFVSETTQREIYLQSNLVVVPTYFESASFPIWEAFRLGLPVVCSNVTSLPNQVGDAAVLFDPNSVDEIYLTIKNVLQDETLSNTIVRNGKERVRKLTALNSALGYRYVYRRALGLDLDEFDSSWLNKGFRF